MWPKLFAQLVELLPHVTRLVPLADRFFTTRSASEKANEAALDALATGVRADLGQVTAAHDGLYRQLQGLDVQLATAAADSARAKVLAEETAARITVLEGRLATLTTGIKAAVVLLALTFAGVAALLLRSR